MGSWTIENLMQDLVFGTDRNAPEGSMLYRSDLTHYEEVLNTFHHFMPDAVIHLGAVTGATGENEMEQSLRQAYRNFEVNAMGTTNVCEAMRVTGVKKLIYASSFATYGRTDPDRLPIDENTGVDLHHAYANSKYAGELVVRTYAEDFGFKSAIFRLPFVVGEHQKEKNALREFINAAEKGESLDVYGDGSQLRTFIHALDVVSAFDKTLNVIDDIGTKPVLFVLGNTPVSMLHLAEMVIEKVGSGSVKFVESSRAFSQFSDYTKAMQTLGWTPTIGIQEIISRMVESDRVK